MKTKGRKRERHERIEDPRRLTPEGHFKQKLLSLDFGEEPVFFSYSEMLVPVLILFGCLVVGTILWLHPPQIIYLNVPHVQPATELVRPASAAKLPKFKAERYEEAADDDPEFNDDVKQPSAAASKNTSAEIESDNAN